MPKEPREIKRKSLFKKEIKFKPTPKLTATYTPTERLFIDILGLLSRANTTRSYSEGIKPALGGGGSEIDVTGKIHKELRKIILYSNNYSVMLVLDKNTRINPDNELITKFGTVSKDRRTITIIIPKLKVNIKIIDNTIQFGISSDNIKTALALLKFCESKTDLLKDPRNTKLTQNRQKG